MGEMSKKEQQEYDRLVEHSEQMELPLQRLQDIPVTYGYARVSTRGQATDGNSLEAQETALRGAGASEVYVDVYTGTKVNRPELQKLLEKLKPGDTLVVTKLDRIARSARQGLELVDELNDRGVTINILNMGILNNSPNGKLMRTMMLAYAEFERDMIVQRTQEGKAVARQKPGFREGRPKKFTQEQIDMAVELLATHSYTEVSKLTGISRSTLLRAKHSAA